MTDIQIGRDDIEQLGRTLDTLKAHVPGREWTVLSAVVAAGAEALGFPLGGAAAAEGQDAPPAFGEFSPGPDDTGGTGGGTDPQRISALPPDE